MNLFGFVSSRNELCAFVTAVLAASLGHRCPFRSHLPWGHTTEGHQLPSEHRASPWHGFCCEKQLKVGQTCWRHSNLPMLCLGKASVISQRLLQRVGNFEGSLFTFSIRGIQVLSQESQSSSRLPIKFSFGHTVEKNHQSPASALSS